MFSSSKSTSLKHLKSRQTKAPLAPPISKVIAGKVRAQPASYLLGIDSPWGDEEEERAGRRTLLL